MDNREQLKQYIKACEHMIKFFTKMIDNSSPTLSTLSKEDKLKELTELRYEIKKDTWPEAEDLKTSKTQKHLKLLGELVSAPFKNKSVLEFGCSDHELSSIIKNKFDAKQVVSFDHFLYQELDQNLLDQNVIFTDIFKVVQQAAPYDIIIAHDVLDHLDKPVLWLKQMAQVCNKTSGRLYVRCHPWTSRNGTHLSQQMNKAFLHLIFSDDELATLGISNKYTRKITDNIETYKRFFEEANLRLLNHKIYTKSMELVILKNPVVANRIKLSTRIENNINDVLEIEHIDFELKP